MQTNPNTATTTPTTPTPNVAPTEQTNAEKITRAQMLLHSSFQLADDESVLALTWGERDALCRNLSEVMRLVREVHPAAEGRAN
jgi:hypothetical protein